MNQSSISKMSLAIIVTALMLSTVTHYSAFGQFNLPDVSNSPSTQSEEPTTEPPMTDDLCQTVETAIGGEVVPPNTTVTTFTDDTGLTINHVPPGWTVIDHDNTSPQAIETGSNSEALLMCPPYSKPERVSDLTLRTSGERYSCDKAGEVLVTHYTSTEDERAFVNRATEKDPETGIFVLRELTAQDIRDMTLRDVFMGVVQSKTVPVNITATENGTLLQEQVPGLLTLWNDGEYNLALVTLHFVVYHDHDNKNATAYESSVWGPGFYESAFSSGFDTSDPRGEPIKVHGIGLDNLPAVLDEPMKIINSISVSPVERTQNSVPEAPSELPRNETDNVLSEEAAQRPEEPIYAPGYSPEEIEERNANMERWARCETDPALDPTERNNCLFDR